jgi:hypothetical protein
MKKGMELSLNVVVVAAVLLITAIVLIVIFGGGVRDFVSGLFGASCSGKLKAMCAPQGPGDDPNNDGISDSASFSLQDDYGTEVTSGPCSVGGQVSDKYKGACKALAEYKTQQQKTAADTQRSNQMVSVK